MPNNAATTFRDAFLPQLIFLKHNANIGNIGSTDELSGILQFGYIHYHLKAFEVFKNYLSAKERADIDKAWKQYCYNQDNPEILFLSNTSLVADQKAKWTLRKKWRLNELRKLLNLQNINKLHTTSQFSESATPPPDFFVIY